MDITSDPDTRRSAIGILTLFDREVQPAAVRILEVGQVKKSYILIFVGGPLIDFGAWWYAVNTISPNLRHLYCTTHNFSPGNGRHRGPAVLSTRGRRLRARALGVASHWPFEEWGRFLPEHNTAVSLLDRLVHHGVVVVHERRVVPDERSSNERRSVLVKEEVRILRGVETSPGHQQGLETGHCPFPPATCNLVKNDACGESVCLAEQLECPLHLLLTGLAGGGDE